MSTATSTPTQKVGSTGAWAKSVTNATLSAAIGGSATVVQDSALVSKGFQAKRAKSLIPCNCSFSRLVMSLQ
mgnify:CR=1 FL=1